MRYVPEDAKNFRLGRLNHRRNTAKTLFREGRINAEDYALINPGCSIEDLLKGDALDKQTAIFEFQKLCRKNGVR